jgi:hypothetical protein
MLTVECRVRVSVAPRCCLKSIRGAKYGLKGYEPDNFFVLCNRAFPLPLGEIIRSADHPHLLLTSLQTDHKSDRQKRKTAVNNYPVRRENL